MTLTWQLVLFEVLNFCILVAILGSAAIGGTADEFDQAWLMIMISASIAGLIALMIGTAGKSGTSSAAGAGVPTDQGT